MIPATLPHCNNRNASRLQPREATVLTWKQRPRYSILVILSKARKAVTFPVVSARMKKPLQTNGLPSGNSHNYGQIGIFDREIIFILMGHGYVNLPKGMSPQRFGDLPFRNGSSLRCSSGLGHLMDSCISLEHRSTECKCWGRQDLQG